MANPPSFSVGPLDGLKQTGIRPWAELGPWAPGRLAAMEYSVRYIERHPLPMRWDWAAEALDFKAPDTFIRGVLGGEPVVIRAIAQTKAQYIAFPMPGNGRAAQKAITDRTMLGANKVAQQTSNKGFKNVSQTDVRCDQRGECADFRRFGLDGIPLSKLFGPSVGRLHALVLAYPQRGFLRKSATI